MKKEKKKRLHRIAERAKVRRERKLETVNGKITITHSGFGFVTLPENEQGEKPEDVFIPPQFVGDAMDGDDVKVALLPPRDDHPGDRDRGPAGKVIEVIGRNREELVGELLAGHRGPAAQQAHAGRNRDIRFPERRKTGRLGEGQTAEP